MTRIFIIIDSPAISIPEATAKTGLVSGNAEEYLLVDANLVVEHAL